MVRVGGGWDTLDHFLLKHDPCRMHTIAGGWGWVLQPVGGARVFQGGWGYTRINVFGKKQKQRTSIKFCFISFR